MTYSEKLKDPRWQKKRLEIMERDIWACRLCGDTETELHVHHENYNGEPWESDNLITLCKYCHFLIEELRISYKDVIKLNKNNTNTDEQLYLILYKSNGLAAFDFIKVNDSAQRIGILLNNDAISLVRDFLTKAKKEINHG